MKFVSYEQIHVPGVASPLEIAIVASHWKPEVEIHQGKKDTAIRVDMVSMAKIRFSKIAHFQLDILLSYLFVGEIFLLRWIE